MQAIFLMKYNFELSSIKFLLFGRKSAHIRSHHGATFSCLVIWVISTSHTFQNSLFLPVTPLLISHHFCIFGLGVLKASLLMLWKTLMMSMTCVCLWVIHNVYPPFRSKVERLKAQVQQSLYSTLIKRGADKWPTWLEELIFLLLVIGQ